MPFDLHRFLSAQEPVYARVLDELRAGEKHSHWMWFIFPQLAGLGHSQMAQLYAIESLAEAKAYLAHPLLGARLRECTVLVNNIPDRTIDQIFGYPDDLKFHSSMTLFSHAAEDKQVFLDALNRYFSGQPDEATIGLLNPVA